MGHPDQHPAQPDRAPCDPVPGRLDDRGVLRAARRLRSPHPRFGHFLEGLASSAVLPDEPAQRRFVQLANRHLNPMGAQLSQHGEADGYSPVPARRARPRHRTPPAQPHLRHPGQARHPLHQRPRQRHRGCRTRRQGAGLRPPRRQRGTALEAPPALVAGNPRHH
ncbi:hypothetical protein AB0C77_16495 [Streptomyces sp. NPDC048629]|uniref:AbiJ-related protein n=1 Tax=Streptomyces sp. NPDC048629 TaxID=3154824 RepID=UPI00342F0026